MVIFLRLFGMICVAVGLLHVVLGLGADNLLGAGLGRETIANASLDSQNRFYGAAFMLFGVVAWICSNDLKQHALLFRLTMLMFFIGGVARLISAAIYGSPSLLIQLLAVSELALPPLMIWWHSGWLRRQAPVNDSFSPEALL
jgi:hypothetical protein